MGLMQSIWPSLCRSQPPSSIPFAVQLYKYAYTKGVWSWQLPKRWYSDAVQTCPNQEIGTRLAKKKRNLLRNLAANDTNPLFTADQSLLHQSLPKSFPVVAVCTAESYDFLRLLPFLQSHNRYRPCPAISDNIIHLRIDGEITEIFIFRNGSFVIWAPPDPGAFLLKLRETLGPFELNPNQLIETEEMQFRPPKKSSFPPNLGGNTNNASGNGNGNALSFEHAGIVGETLVVAGFGKNAANQKEGVRSMIAFSNGLADSVKLAVLENLMEMHIEMIRKIPGFLEQGKKLPQSRAQVLSLTGRLLHIRALLNLQSELLDPPELYWLEPELESLYVSISRFLDIRQRVSILNKKLDYANELAHILRSHLSEQHGLKLEWSIIILIAVEVAFETLHLIGKFAG